jgi:hypothetical protein
MRYSHASIAVLCGVGLDLLALLQVSLSSTAQYEMSLPKLWRYAAGIVMLLCRVHGIFTAQFCTRGRRIFAAVVLFLVYALEISWKASPPPPPRECGIMPMLQPTVGAPTGKQINQLARSQQLPFACPPGACLR